MNDHTGNESNSTTPEPDQSLDLLQPKTVFERRGGENAEAANTDSASTREEPRYTKRHAHRQRDTTVPPFARAELDAKPGGYEKPKVTILDQIIAGQVTQDQIAQQLMDEAYAGLKQYCDIPKGYHHCELGDTTIDIDTLEPADLEELLTDPPSKIVNPEPIHLEAIEFCNMALEGDPLICRQRSPLRPLVGAWLFGPPGTGKTHIMAAFGLRLKKLLDEKLLDYKRTIAAFVAQEYKLFTKTASKMSNAFEAQRVYEINADLSGGVREDLQDPAGQFHRRLAGFKESLRKLPFQPTDLLYLSFEQLCELYLKEGAESRKATQEALERAAIVFIDDVHPEQDQGRFEVIRRLIERRYELGLHGTFITTNLTQEELSGKVDEVDEDAECDKKDHVADRLISRLGETFLQFNFKNCKDWRRKVKSKRLEPIRQRIAERLSRRRATNDKDSEKPSQ